VPLKDLFSAQIWNVARTSSIVQTLFSAQYLLTIPTVQALSFAQELTSVLSIGKIVLIQDVKML